MRKAFFEALYQEMLKNERIWVITGDLGFGLLDKIRDEFPDRFINCGASEQAMVDIGVGLALEGRIPFVYSITPFLLYRPFESLRNYLDHEGIPVKLIASGRGKDYLKDGFSHWAEEDWWVMATFGKIKSFWPETLEQAANLASACVKDSSPWYINLKR